MIATWAPAWKYSACAAVIAAGLSASSRADHSSELQVVAVRLQQGGQPAVEHDRPVLQPVRQRAAGSS